MALNWFVYLILPPINHSRIVYLLNIKTAHTFSRYMHGEYIGTLFGNDKIILTSRKLVRFRCFGINSFQTNNYFVTQRRVSLPSFSQGNYILYKHLH